MPTPATTTPMSLWTALTRLLGGTDRTHETQATDESDPPADESTPQADELADHGPDSNGLVSDANARTEQDHVLDHVTASAAPAVNRGDGWNDHDWEDGANPSSDWADVPTDDAYDTPIPYAAPTWLAEARAVEYDDYDAAIPFHVVDDYTRHMSHDTTDTSDGDDL